MNTFLLPILAFVATVLAMLLAHEAWIRYFDRLDKAKKKRLKLIHNTLHPNGQGIDNAQPSLQGNAFETWLRSRSGTFGKVENLLRRADSRLNVWSLTGIMLALFMIVVLSGLLRHANLLLLFPLAMAAAGTPLLWLFRQASRRRRAFGNKLPETLDYISRVLRAGHSLTSAIGMVGRELPDPIGQEFKTVSDEILFGIPFKEAIGKLADRGRSSDLNFFAVSIMILHETGGNLTELLDGLADTMRERIKLRGKIRTLSSEGRASAWVLGSMPFALAGILTIANPGYISLLWTTHQGNVLLLIGAVLMTAGFFLLNRVVQIKV